MSNDFLIVIFLSSLCTFDFIFFFFYSLILCFCHQMFCFSQWNYIKAMMFLDKFRFLKNRITNDCYRIYMVLEINGTVLVTILFHIAQDYNSTLIKQLHS